MYIIQHAIGENCRFKCPHCQSIIGCTMEELNNCRRQSAGITGYRIICPDCLVQSTVFPSDIDREVVYED
jgi:hypothetical protein